MERLLELQNKIQTTSAALGRLESELPTHRESRGLYSNILSLRKLHRNLEAEFQETANLLGFDVCHYRLMQDRPTVRAFSDVIGLFQTAISQAYDALKNGAKSRRLLSPEALLSTEMRVAYTFPGSFGVVFTIPNDRLLFPDVQPLLAQATQTVFRVAKANTDTEAVVVAVRQIGRAPIAAIYDWAKVNAQHNLGADIEWRGLQERRDAVSIQAPEFQALSDSMERTGEKTIQERWVTGTLVGADITRHTFRFWPDGLEAGIRGRFEDAISESHKAELPRRYSALLSVITQTTLATETEDISYTLRELKPI